MTHHYTGLGAQSYGAFSAAINTAANNANFVHQVAYYVWVCRVFLEMGKNPILIRSHPWKQTDQNEVDVIFLVCFC